MSLNSRHVQVSYSSFVDEFCRWPAHTSNGGFEPLTDDQLKNIGGFEFDNVNTGGSESEFKTCGRLVPPDPPVSIIVSTELIMTDPRDTLIHCPT